MPFSAPRKIEVRYDAADVQNMLDLLKAAPFPDKAPIDTEPWKLGIDYNYLKNLKTHFETKWSWVSLEKRIAHYNNYIVHYENCGDSLDLHYVYARSVRSDAIPLLLLHGWPGTFFDFHKVVEPLINPPNAKLPAFHVVIPSIPGFFLSSLPRRDGFSIVDIAKVYNSLMTEALGYRTHAAQGGDWGHTILRVMGSLYPEAVPVLHFNAFHTPTAPDSDPSKYSAVEKRLVASKNEFSTKGHGYFTLQATKPFTIGIAIASSPLAVLTYIAEKMYSWSDPERIKQEDIIDTIALYWLSKSFSTSVLIYHQSIPERSAVVEDPKKLVPEGKTGFSAFPYEILGSPKTDLDSIGMNLVYYKEHASGGHFPALDCPDEYVEDLREFIGQHWQ